MCVPIENNELEVQAVGTSMHAYTKRQRKDACTTKDVLGTGTCDKERAGDNSGLIPDSARMPQDCPCVPAVVTEKSACVHSRSTEKRVCIQVGPTQRTACVHVRCIEKRVCMHCGATGKPVCMHGMATERQACVHNDPTNKAACMHKTATEGRVCAHVRLSEK